MLSLLVSLTVSAVADSPKREFRATWFTTHYGIDWPKTKATSSSTITTQKKEMTDIFDKLQRGNMNAVCFQARPVSDAFYQSSYEPWSHILTGTRGKNPGYDPLAYAVQEAHKRGMELHAWVNPFRYEVTAGERTTAISNGKGLAGSDPIRDAHPEWLLTYSNGTFNGTILDPGNPAARAYVVKVLMEIVNNYDIDGILMDDYFYAYGGTTNEDAASVAAYKPASKDVGDWRRENVNKVIHALYDSIQVVKPWVKFGMAPGGIYSTTPAAAAAFGLTLPSGISGGDVWKVLYCDPLAWIDGGYIDYMAPQIYWATTHTSADYDVLCQWWGQSIATLNSRRTDGKRVHSYVSQACYKYEADELGLEIDDNRQFAPYSAPGSIFYNTNTYLSFNGNATYSTLAQTHFTSPALPPAITWKNASPLAAPTGLSLSGATLTWNHPTAQRFSVYLFPKGMAHNTALGNSLYLQGMTYSNSFTLTGAANLDNMTMAVCAMDRYGNEYGAAYYNDAAALPVYTVTVTSDASQGSVTGGGEYMQGTTATLTATPEYGYEFAEWQDHNTDNPRTVTVTGESSYTALFDPVAEEPFEEGTLTRELLWQKSLAATGYMATGNANRSIAVYGDRIYLSHSIDGDNPVYKYHIINASTGSLIQSVTLPDKYMAWNNLRITEDGKLLLGNSATSAASQNIYTAALGSNNTSTVASLNNTDFGRTDYFYTIGTFSGSGYALMLSNVNNKALYIKFKNGEIRSNTVIANSTLPKGTSAKAVPVSAETFLASAAGQPATLHSLKTGARLENWSASVKPASVSASGLCYFTIAGHKYLMTPADVYGSFDTFEITDGLASATTLFSATPALGSNSNGAYTVDAAVRRDGYSAYVYLLAPNNGIAAYKYTFTATGTGYDDVAPCDVSIAATPSGFHAAFSGTQTVQVYAANGILLSAETASEEYDGVLPQGVFLVKIGNTVQRIIR